MNQSDAVRADNLPKGRANSIEKPGLLSGCVHGAGTRIVVELPDQMREHFGIRVGAKVGIAAPDEFILEGLIVFDNAVVDQCQFAARVKMWMRVFIIYFA